MGRPNLTEIRTAEILDAFERCVARYGLEGSSLERVAEEAGMQRSILRHYVGNRDDLIEALAKRVVAKYRQSLNDFLGSLSKENRPGQLLTFLLPDKPVESAESVMVVEALIAAGDKYPQVQQLMLDYIDDLVQATAKELQAANPNAPRQRCWGAAYGIVSICFNQESLSPLGLPPRYLKAARSCSEVLIQSLREC